MVIRCQAARAHDSHPLGRLSWIWTQGLEHIEQGLEHITQGLEHILERCRSHGSGIDVAGTLKELVDGFGVQGKRV